VAGKCEYACLTGYYDLDKDPTNGCEYLCPYTKPLAAELCNGLDDNCTGRSTKGVTLTPIRIIAANRPPLSICERRFDL